MPDPTANEQLYPSNDSSRYTSAEAGLAPLRYDIARARYLQKQRANRESMIDHSDFQIMANRLHTAILHARRLLSRHLSSLRRAAF